MGLTVYHRMETGNITPIIWCDTCGKEIENPLEDGIVLWDTEDRRERIYFAHYTEDSKQCYTELAKIHKRRMDRRLGKTPHRQDTLPLRVFVLRFVDILVCTKRDRELEADNG